MSESDIRLPFPFILNIFWWITHNALLPYVIRSRRDKTGRQRERNVRVCERECVCEKVECVYMCAVRLCVYVCMCVRECVCIVLYCTCVWVCVCVWEREREREREGEWWGGGEIFFLLPSWISLISFVQLEPNDLLYYSLFVHQLDQKHFARFTFSNYNSSHSLLPKIGST